MGAKLQEIEGRFVGERFRSGEFLIGSIVLCNGSVEAAKKAGFTGGDRLTIKGDAEADELKPKQTYRFYGKWTSYQDEKQFTFNTFVAATAHDREGVVAYLEAAGKGCGVGYRTASKAWDKWGSDAVRVIRENPRELLALNRRLTDEELSAIKSRLEAQAKTEHAQIEVTNLLSGRGFPKSVFRKTIKAWGNQAAITIRENPYLMMRFRGVGFKRCDALYLELGLDPSAMIRQALCAWYAIASNTDGHVWFPIEFAKQAVRKTIGSKADPDKAIEYACELAKISPDHYGALAVLCTNGAGQICDNGTRWWVAEGRKATTELKLAELVVDALNETRPQQLTQYAEHTIIDSQVLDHARCHRCSRPLTAPQVHVWNGRPYGPTCITTISDGEGVDVVSLDDWLQSNPSITKIVQEIASGTIEVPQFSIWPEIESIKLIDGHQRSQLSLALAGRIGILGGSPGTGKTHTTAMLVKTLLECGIAPEDIIIGAPTGKATVRLNEAFHAAGVNVRAKTWHSWLGVGEPDEETGGWSFKHNAGNPWSCKVIIGDEESMKDTSIMCAVFSARPRGAHVLLVGDINQLPPVGTGAPLRDLIAAGLPYGQLTEIKRNSGGIVEACAAIRDGQRWEAGNNLHIVPSASASDQLDATIEILGRLSGDWDPVWDAQVIVAVNKRSPLSRKLVNERLQMELNPNREIEGSPFRLDDKVVCTSNGWYPLVPGFDASSLDEAMVREKDEHGVYEAYVANGELGRVLEVEEKKLRVSLSNPLREIIVPRGKASSEDSEGTSTAGTDDDDDKSTTGCNFELAYAISCHKMQGSECPNVVILVDEYPGARSICSREWFTTAISRAKNKCFVVGRKETADGMCRKVALTNRRTFLCERIRLLQAEQLLEAIR